VTLVDLSVSLAGVLVALPAALMLFGAPVEDEEQPRAARRRGNLGEPASAGGVDQRAAAQPLAVALAGPGSSTRSAPAREEQDGGGR
jgi:hypothetical protein